MVEVTHEDRDATADAVQSARPILADEIRAGRMDAYAGVVAFARHRIAARKHAFEEAAKVADTHGNTVSNDPVGKACSRNIARAIRALSDNGA